MSKKLKVAVLYGGKSTELISHIKMLIKIKKLFGREYTPLNKIEINKKALINNFRYLSQINKNIKIAPVLKSNAYGHGLVQVAQILDQLNPPMLCVDSLFEAYELLKAGIKSEILIMGYIHPQSLKVKQLPFSYAVFSKEQLEVINNFQKGAKVHIKVDTGMHRLGVTMDEIQEFVKTLKNYTNIHVDGVMSHIAHQEDSNSKLSELQLANFNKVRKVFEKSNLNPKWYHLSASEYLLKNSDNLSGYSNLARCGISLFGIDQTGKHNQLKPVLKVTSQIVQIKKMNKGEKVGYSGTFMAEKDMVLGVLPIGYNDGVDRRLSNKGHVLVRNKNCRILGLVSMNITTIDLTSVNDPKIGEEAVIFSDKSEHNNSIANGAKLCRTIPYELLIHLSPTSLRRKIINP